MYFHNTALMMGDKQRAEVIMSKTDAKDIKTNCGRNLSMKPNDPRTRDAFNLFWIANKAKYSRHPHLMTRLLGTEGTRLVEVGTGWSVWATGLTQGQHNHFLNTSAWREGCKNMFGDLLTLLREHFMEEHARKLAGITATASVSDGTGRQSRSNSTSHKRPASKEPDPKRQRQEDASDEEQTAVSEGETY